MKIKSVTIRDFKRFTDLQIEDVPNSARLILLVGPNGSGKSSVFESFNAFSWPMKSKHQGQYLKVVETIGLKSQQVTLLTLQKNSHYSNEQVQIKFHDYDQPFIGTLTEAGRKSFYIRSCYRSEGDFHVGSITKIGDVLDDHKRPPLLISLDSRVSDNYQRLVARSLSEVFDVNLDDTTTRKQIRERLTARIATSLKNVLPDLRFVGLGDPMSDGTFIFEKGLACNWKYKNLSGGEKAAFDLLLDFVVKAQRFDNTVFCVDEPEVHMHTSVQAPLLEEMLRQLSPTSQLWIATHSAGMMRAARDLYAKNPGEVVFLDFGGHDFDEPVVMRPSIPDRAFWKRNFEVALGDLAQLVAPAHIIFCEGHSQDNGIGFDAQCYEKIFAGEFPDVEFVSSGGTTELQKNALSVSAVMERVLSGVKFTVVRDRDDASENEVREWGAQGLRVLSRRTIESYLWDNEVLERLCILLNQPDKVTEVLELKQQEMEASRQQRGNQIDDVKSAAGNIYNPSCHL